MKLPFLILTFFIVFFSLAAAQDYEYVGILEALVGELPDPCVDLQDPLCWKCLTIGKILPLAFFTGFGFIITLVIVGRMLAPGGGEEAQKVVDKYKSIIIFITIVVAFSVLHIANPRTLVGIFGKVWNIWHWLIGIIVAVGALYVVAGGVAVIVRALLAFVLVIALLYFFSVAPVPEIAKECYP